MEKEREGLRQKWFSSGDQLIPALPGSAATMPASLTQAIAIPSSVDSGSRVDGTSAHGLHLSSGGYDYTSGTVVVADAPHQIVGWASPAARTQTCVLSSSTVRSIYQARKDFLEALQSSDIPEPWLLMEHLGDEILDDILHECASHLLRVCDETVEKITEDEFKRES